MTSPAEGDAAATPPRRRIVSASSSQSSTPAPAPAAPVSDPKPAAGSSSSSSSSSPTSGPRKPAAAKADESDSATDSKHDGKPDGAKTAARARPARKPAAAKAARAAEPASPAPRGEGDDEGDDDRERSDDDDDSDEPIADARADLADDDAETDTDEAGPGESIHEGADHEGYIDREAALAIPLSSPRSRDRERERDDDEEEEREDKSAKDFALSRNDPMQAYLREVQRHPLLTPEEEQTLARRYSETQDVAAAARMVTANLRLVVKIAYEYRRAYKNIMDLVQEGNIGLMQAVKKYDPNRGVKLSSYSAWWIRAYILRYIINNWRLVKLGTTQAQRKLFFNLNKEKAKLAAMGIDPTPELIAKNLGVETQEAAEMERRLSSGEMSLDAPVGDNEGRPVSRIELMPSAGAGPDSAVAEGELSGIVHEKLVEFRSTLKGKDLDIFDKRLVADEPLTLQELGDQFGISRERVRQIEARLTMHLRTFLVQALGDAVEV